MKFYATLGNYGILPEKEEGLKKFTSYQTNWNF
jgi:hypothetical protein